jgi:hypothetical protein
VERQAWLGKVRPGQRQTADNLETMGIASYQHAFSSHALVDFRGMVRDNASGFNSNPQSTPISRGLSSRKIGMEFPRLPEEQFPPWDVAPLEAKIGNKGGNERYENAFSTP